VLRANFGEGLFSEDGCIGYGGRRSSSEVSGLIKFLVGVAAFSIAFHFGMRYVLTYRFTDTRVQAVLFRILPVCTIRYDRIVEVSISPYARAYFGWSAWVPNRLVGPFVGMRRRSGLVVLMTPAKPEEFARELSLRVQERTGKWPLVS
jgi:hypothetical protein